MLCYCGGCKLYKVFAIVVLEMVNFSTEIKVGPAGVAAISEHSPLVWTLNTAALSVFTTPGARYKARIGPGHTGTVCIGPGVPIPALWDTYPLYQVKVLHTNASFADMKNIHY